MTRAFGARSALLATLTFTALAVPGALASATDTTGSLTFHDDPDASATLQIADCTFWVRGHGIEPREGTVSIYHNQGRAGVELLATADFTGTPDGEGGHDFLVGPFTVDASGHTAGMRLLAEVVVEMGDTASGDPERYVQSDGDVRAYCGQKFIPCIDDLAAMALDDGDVRLDWSAPDNATHYFVLRTDGSQLPNGQTDWVTLANVTATEYTDTTAEAGVAYTYRVTASDGALALSDSCPSVNVTAVPFFGAPLLAGIALAGVVGSYAWMRRR